MREFGLPVPKLLHKPFKNEKGDTVAIYELLLGENLQKLSIKSKKDLDIAKELLISAVIMLTSANKFIEKSKFGKTLQRISLYLEIEKLNKKNNPWFNEKIFQIAIKKLKIELKSVNTPLVFSNGDSQPGNFLTREGKITGVLDFESASFQDPLMGFVKYPIYDLKPLSRTNLIQQVIKEMGFSQKDFNIRLIIGCLKTMKKEIPVNINKNDEVNYRNSVISLLNQNLNKI